MLFKCFSNKRINEMYVLRISSGEGKHNKILRVRLTAWLGLLLVVVYIALDAFR